MLVNTARLAGLDIKMMTTELTDVWRLVELHRHHQQQIQDLPRGGDTLETMANMQRVYNRGLGWSPEQGPGT